MEVGPLFEGSPYDDALRKAFGLGECTREEFIEIIEGQVESLICSDDALANMVYFFLQETVMRSHQDGLDPVVSLFKMGLAIGELRERHRQKEIQALDNLYKDPKS